MKNPEIVMAILGGSVIIALAVFFGLQSRPPTQTKPLAPSAGPSPSVRAPAVIAPPVAGDMGGLGVPTRSLEEQRLVEGGVRTALLASKPALVERCWRPSAAKAPEPKIVKLSWNGTIGPEGTPLAFGVSQSRDAYRADMQSCIQGELRKLKVANPPSAPTVVTVEFELP